MPESGVHLRVNHSYLLKKQISEPLVVSYDFDPNVAIVKIFPGISEGILKGILAVPHLKGVVLETYGSGNALTQQWFIDTLADAVQRGISIVNVTQCVGGSVIPGKYEAGSHFEKIGIINGKDMSSEAAVTKLMFLLGKGVDAKCLKIKFEKSLCGEIS